MGAANLNGRWRAFRWRRQGLEGSLAKASAAEVLEETGWMRSVGGASPYLGLFARAGGYFRWAAPASAAQFQWWSGLGARASKAAAALKSIR